MMPPKFTNNRRFYVYIVTNNINKKIYIGKSNTNKNRWKDHLNIAKNKYKNTYKYLHRSINKYGAENFIYEILEYFDDENISYEAERKYVAKYMSNVDGYGMNLNSGGKGGMIHNKETIEKIRKWHIGYKFSDESKEKMRKSHLGQIPVTRKFDDNTIKIIKEIYFNKKQLKIKSFIIIKELAKIYKCSIHCIGAITAGTNYKNIIHNINKIPEGFKSCTICHNILDLYHFNFELRSKDGLCSRCYLCERKCGKLRNK